MKWGALLLPSKEMLLSLPLLLASQVAMEPHGWGAVQLLLLGTPLLSLAAINFVAMPFVVAYAAVAHGCALAPAMARASAVVRLELVTPL